MLVLTARGDLLAEKTSNELEPWGGVEGHTQGLGAAVVLVPMLRCARAVQRRKTGSKVETSVNDSQNQVWSPRFN